MQPRAEKPRLGLEDIIAVFSAQSFARIKELFEIEITPEEVKQFAEANDCFEDAVPLAEHICLVLIEAVQNQYPTVFGLDEEIKLKEELRLRVAQVIAIIEPTAFDDIFTPQKQADPRLRKLAVQFLNSKF